MKLTCIILRSIQSQASGECFKPYFERYINKDEARLTTDGWNGYLPLEIEFEIRQKLSKSNTFTYSKTAPVVFPDQPERLHYYTIYNCVISLCYCL